eukprot:scaffold21578_cov101-Isochrysis_galbana.AAC.3
MLATVRRSSCSACVVVCVAVAARGAASTARACARRTCVLPPSWQLAAAAGVRTGETRARADAHTNPDKRLTLQFLPPLRPPACASRASRSRSASAVVATVYLPSSSLPAPASLASRPRPGRRAGSTDRPAALPAAAPVVFTLASAAAIAHEMSRSNAAASPPGGCPAPAGPPSARARSASTNPK